MGSIGFSGRVTNTSLHEVVQLMCIGGHTRRLHVRSGTRKGDIYFRSGEIIHAQNGASQGEEAFYQILSWETGAFECDEQAPQVETIRESWEFLLMESMRRVESPAPA
ncbi:MAG: DUF4388 domain-containing protein [Thermodesulfobacteriota bacterium]